MWLLQGLDLDGLDVLHLYISDDRTDEDPLRTVADCGMGIIVEARSRPKAASYVLKHLEEVRLFLHHLIFSADELSALFNQLGYPFAYETIPNNMDYYLRRTSHGSTLSRVVHSWLLGRSDRTHSWHLCAEALEREVSDVQGGTTPEGIHLGAMGSIPVATAS